MRKSKLSIPTPSTPKIGELFTNNYFAVPNYQRNYAWQESEVSDFWDDLMDIVNGERDGHFFGQIVTYKNSNNNGKDIQEVIDGQQRLTTSLIFQSVLRNIATEIKNDNCNRITDDTQEKLLMIDFKSKQMIGPADERTLVLQKTADSEETDLRTFFNKLLDLRGEVNFRRDTMSEPMKNMVNAYNFLKRNVIDKLKKYDNIVDRINCLDKITAAFIERFYVVMLSTENKRDAFIIFETLNSRGRDLTASDIIKNHLMYAAKNELEAVDEKWKQIADVLKGDSKRLTRFIKTYWAARYKFVPEAKLYKSLSGQVIDKDDTLSFIDDLENLVILYDVLENPMANKRNSGFFKDKELMRLINVFRHLGVKLYYPIMLAMYRKKYSEQVMKQVLNMALRVFVRHRTIMNAGTNILEKGYAKVAEKIYTEELTTPDEINNYMRETLYRTNKEVQNAYATLNKELKTAGKMKWTVLYLLQEYYDYLEDSNGKIYQETFINDNYVPCHIKEDKIDAELVNYIGNYSLIEKKLAVKLTGAKSDEERANIFKQSALKYNQNIVEWLAKGWNDNKIDERQKQMAFAAINIW